MGKNDKKNTKKNDKISIKKIQDFLIIKYKNKIKKIKINKKKK